MFGNFNLKQSILGFATYNQIRLTIIVLEYIINDQV